MFSAELSQGKGYLKLNCGLEKQLQTQMIKVCKKVWSLPWIFLPSCLLIWNTLFAESQNPSGMLTLAFHFIFWKPLLLQQTGHESDTPRPQTNIPPNYLGNEVHLTKTSIFPGTFWLCMSESLTSVLVLFLCRYQITIKKNILLLLHPLQLQPQRTYMHIGFNVPRPALVVCTDTYSGCG